MRSLETSSITSHTHTTVINYEQLFNDHCVETQLTQYQLKDIGCPRKKVLGVCPLPFSFSKNCTDWELFGE